MKKYLKKIAEDNYQLNRTYDILMNDNLFTDDDVYESIGHMYVSWENANADGYIEEHYDNFSEWLKDYVIATSQDIVTKARNKNEEFASDYSLLSDEEKEKLLEQLSKYLLSKSDEIEEHVL